MASVSTERMGSLGASLSIDVEDWFHADNVRDVLTRETWESCELRVERNTMRILEILQSSNARATFFVLGWVAEKCPQLVRAIAAAGHEVASHGYGHEHVYSLGPDEFRSDVLRSKQYLEDLTGKAVRATARLPSRSPIGQFRSCRKLGSTTTLPSYRASRMIAMAGWMGWMQADRSFRSAMVSMKFASHASGSASGGSLGAGAAISELIPYQPWLWGVRRILRSGMPYVFYIHPWEIDPGQPRVAGIKATYRFRHRVNLQRCEGRFAALVGTFEWMPICDLVDGWKVCRGKAEMSRGRADKFSVHLSRDAQAGREFSRRPGTC